MNQFVTVAKEEDTVPPATVTVSLGSRRADRQ